MRACSLCRAGRTPNWPLFLNLGDFTVIVSIAAFQLNKKLQPWLKSQPWFKKQDAAPGA